MNMADLTVTVPEGAPMEHCIPVRIFNDVSLEEDETLEFFFAAPLEDGVVPEDPSVAEVTIMDDDGGELCVMHYSETLASQETASGLWVEVVS